MLDGAPAAGGHPLNDLLAVAAAPARDSELVGEHAAVTAFRAARLATADQSQRSSPAKLFSARLAAVVAVLAVAVGGVATAAATGHLPGPLGGNSPVTPAPSSHPTTSAAPSSTSHPTTTDRHDDRGAAPAPDSPSPSMTGLCNAFTTGSEHGKALDNPAFTALITTAGGRDRVDAYCAELLGGQRGKGPATPPTTKENDHGAQGKGPPSSHPEPGSAHGKGHPDH
jgi:hypothetical protein